MAQRKAYRCRTLFGRRRFFGKRSANYAEEEIAKFINGDRSLDTVDAFFDELEALGAAEYVQYYADYYESTK